MSEVRSPLVRSGVLEPGVRWRNWGRSAKAHPQFLAHAASAEEVQETIAFAREEGLTVKPIGAGHSFIIFMRNFYPINILNGVKNCPEVARIFCATSNPVTVVVAENSQGRGILGVIDGSSPLDIETETDIQKRKSFLRMIGYKA